MIIECNDFILSFDKNDEALATVYKNLIEYRKIMELEMLVKVKLKK
ncbi:hypothetical protein KKZ20_10535 [Clostridioides difficile]|nr:hypothetical protein [Clostridioides difficile]MBT2146750.1 hypothetical protein [Clostridioides difficile]